LGDWSLLRTYFLTSKASPNDSRIVIVVIIVIGEAKSVFHIGGIIAQISGVSINFENLIDFPRLEMQVGKLYSINIVQIRRIQRSFLMKLRILFIVHMIVVLIMAAGLLLAPKTILNLFGLSVGATVGFNASMNFVAQLLGATLVVPGLLGWFGSTMEAESARRSVALTLLIFNIIAFGVSFFVGMLPKVMSVAGWILVVLFLLFAAGFAYLLFMRPSEP
jgi:hypothetical protein